MSRTWYEYEGLIRYMNTKLIHAFVYALVYKNGIRKKKWVGFVESPVTSCHIPLAETESYALIHFYLVADRTLAFLAVRQHPVVLVSAYW